MTKRPSEDEIMAKMQQLTNLLELLEEPRRTQVRDMMATQVGSSFLTAPASTRTDFHSCYPGGLLVHSLNVIRNLNRLAKTLCPGKYSDQTLIFVGAFHDLGKAGDGVEEYYVVNQSDWHQKKGILYDVNQKCVGMPTSERGLFIFQKFGIKLTSDEYLAIRLNDGQYADENKYYGMKEPELALLTHWADMWSCKEEKVS